MEVLLPKTHEFRLHSLAHNSNFTHFQALWAFTTLTDPGHTSIRGILYLQAMAIQYSTFWNKQKLLPGPVSMKDPTHLVDLVMETNETWIPTLSPGTRTQLNVPALVRLGTSLPGSKAQPAPAADDDASTNTGASALTGITGMQIAAPSLNAIRALIQEEVKSVGPGGPSRRATQR